MMKRALFIAVLVAAGGLVPVHAQQDPADIEALRILEALVQTQEAKLAELHTQFEAGRVDANAIRDVEVALGEARLRLTRERQQMTPTSAASLLYEPVPDLNLPPSRLRDVCGMLREVLDGRVNFVLKEGVAELASPALQLKGADLLTLLNVLTESIPELEAKVSIGSQMVPIQDILGEMVKVQLGSTGPQIGGRSVPSRAETYQMMDIASLTAGTRAESITVLFEAHSAVVTTSPRETMTVYLGDLLDSAKLEDICTSIETAWELNPGSGNPPVLRFHPDTGLLVAAGAPEHLQVVRQVVEEMKRRKVELERAAKDFAENERRALLEKIDALEQALRRRDQSTTPAAADAVEDPH
jgi:hypothetical protein